MVDFGTKNDNSVVDGSDNKKSEVKQKSFFKLLLMTRHPLVEYAYQKLISGEGLSKKKKDKYVQRIIKHGNADQFVNLLKMRDYFFDEEESKPLDK